MVFNKLCNDVVSSTHLSSVEGTGNSRTYFVKVSQGVLHGIHYVRLTAGETPGNDPNK